MNFNFSIATDELATIEVIEQTLNYYFKPETTPFVEVDGVVYTTDVVDGKLKVVRADPVKE